MNQVFFKNADACITHHNLDAILLVMSRQADPALSFQYPLYQGEAFAGRCQSLTATPSRQMLRPYETGRLTRTTVPSPGALCAEIVPPCASTSPFAIASPSPMPPESRAL